MSRGSCPSSSRSTTTSTPPSPRRTGGPSISRTSRSSSASSRSTPSGPRKSGGGSCGGYGRSFRTRAGPQACKASCPWARKRPRAARNARSARTNPAGDGGTLRRVTGTSWHGRPAPCMAETATLLVMCSRAKAHLVHPRRSERLLSGEAASWSSLNQDDGPHDRDHGDARGFRHDVRTEDGGDGEVVGRVEPVVRRPHDLGVE